MSSPPVQRLSKNDAVWLVTCRLFNTPDQVGYGVMPIQEKLWQTFSTKKALPRETLPS